MVNYILQEDGSYILQEDNLSKILLEDNFTIGIKEDIISLSKGDYFGGSGEVNKPTGIIRSSEKPELV